MKILSLLLLSLVSASALAEVKPLGTFVPSLCSNASEDNGFKIDIVAVESACMGELSGTGKQAIQLQLNDGTTRTYEVKMKKKVIRMGATTIPFKGVNVEDETETIKGNYYFTTGITVTHNIELKTSSKLEFKSRLEAVFTTM
jgi:hypothetical protein